MKGKMRSRVNKKNWGSTGKRRTTKMMKTPTSCAKKAKKRNSTTISLLTLVKLELKVRAKRKTLTNRQHTTV
jgi:hypothetical protein